jgi:HSP20 family protein
VLHVSYEYKEEEHPDLKSRWLRREYKLQTFRRSFTLNDKINIGGIAAKYNDGVLVLTLPKKASTEPTTQEIKVG